MNTKVAALDRKDSASRGKKKRNKQNNTITQNKQTMKHLSHEAAAIAMVND